MYIIIDCETTGVPRNYKAPISDSSNWPRVVQVAWALYDKDERPLESTVHLVQPDGFKIPPDAQRVHHITTERALAEGKKLKDVLIEFGSAVEKSGVIVAHNIKFDVNVISAEYLRLELQPPFANKKHICTMEMTTSFCRIPGQYGYKWPTLSQLYSILFEKSLEEAHDAGADVAACAKCFFELRHQRVIAI
jgi:DNA polymerase III subunit epsilon